ncbi:MAG: WXG100 family type VII secretion target [Lachnospiraceae bacterium]|nr:WXG100 family type VII secretion target [Lachnospiraceae bacterium]
MAIRVDAETLHAKAAELRNMRASHDENITKVSTLIRGLSDVFEGQAAQAYQNNLESMQPTFTQFSAMLDELAVKLDAVATGFTEFDTGLAGSLHQ